MSPASSEVSVAVAGKGVLLPWASLVKEANVWGYVRGCPVDILVSKLQISRSDANKKCQVMEKVGLLGDLRGEASVALPLPEGIKDGWVLVGGGTQLCLF